MPQMSPMMWEYLFALTCSMIMLMNIKIFWYKTDFNPKTNKKMSIHQKTWKW
nr:ATPase subunit 8 [Phaenacantha marcida]